MHYRLFAGALVLAICVIQSCFVRSQDLSSCIAIKDDQKRLACFDENTKSKAVPSQPTPQEPMSVSDVMADAKDLKGKHVVVEGFALILGETVILYEKQGSMSGLFVEIDKLPRDQRRIIYKSCGEGCDAMVSGRVGSVMMNPGIIADQLQVK